MQKGKYTEYTKGENAKRYKISVLLIISIDIWSMKTQFFA